MCVYVHTQFCPYIYIYLHTLSSQGTDKEDISYEERMVDSAQTFLKLNTILRNAESTLPITISERIWDNLNARNVRNQEVTQLLKASKPQVQRVIKSTSDIIQNAASRNNRSSALYLQNLAYGELNTIRNLQQLTLRSSKNLSSLKSLIETNQYSPLVTRELLRAEATTSYLSLAHAIDSIRNISNINRAITLNRDFMQIPLLWIYIYN